jgi:hypothetical protein
MGYWENTGYVAHGSVGDVAEALVEIITGEGMALVPRPPRREPEAYDSLQYQGGPANARWAIAVFPGAPGWTVIKTAPFELLAETPPDARRMRFVDLCDFLGAVGFQLHVYDTTGAVLVETDGHGKLAMSGAAVESAHEDPFSFHGHRLHEERFALRFDLVPLSRELTPCTHSVRGIAYVDHDAFAERIARVCGGANAARCDNGTIVGTLIPHLPLTIPGARELYFERRTTPRTPLRIDPDAG